MKLYVILLSIISLLASCGKNNKTFKKSDKLPSPVTDIPTNTIDNNDEYLFSRTYEFSYNGCHTGKHSFNANTLSELKNKLCPALQNNTLNNNCAFSIRQEYFIENCYGYTWSI